VVEPEVSPTAMHDVAEMHDTPLAWATPTIDSLAPTVEPLNTAETPKLFEFNPTNMQNVDERQSTSDTRPHPAGAVTCVHDVPFHEAMNAVSEAPWSALVPAATQKLADVHETSSKRLEYSGLGVATRSTTSNSAVACPAVIAIVATASDDARMIELVLRRSLLMTEFLNIGILSK
jgi:hypothetical protein